MPCKRGGKVNRVSQAARIHLHALPYPNYRCTIVKHYYVGCCLIETKISGGAPRVWSRGVRPSNAISLLSTYNQMCLELPLPRNTLRRPFVPPLLFKYDESDDSCKYKPQCTLLYEMCSRRFNQKAVSWIKRPTSADEASHLASICRPFRCTDHKWIPLQVTLASPEKNFEKSHSDAWNCKCFL